MFPDLLATKTGRRVAFFFLYLTEGIPLGFTATAVATQMRRQGLGPAEIGVFVGTLYLPWSWKWIVGPVVDVVYSNKLGRRRAWIVTMQMLMVAGLLASMTIDFTGQLRLFTFVILLVNIFGATQDVAIDALACNVLPEHERGTANGLMFAGAYTGQAVGGSGVLFLTSQIGFQASSALAIGSILAVTLLIALPLRESKEDPPEEDERSGPASIGIQIVSYLGDAWRAFTGSKSAAMAVVVACLPCGTLALTLALASNLAVELGMSDEQIATLMLFSTMIAALFCVLGGFLSDRFGRRRVLVFAAIGMAIPTLALAWLMHDQSYIWPVDMKMKKRPPVAEILVIGYCIASLTFAVFQGLMYGTRTALFMDVCTPKVAATQFTAYMALLNFVTFYSASWQGWAIEKIGYPITLALDSAAGILFIAVLPWVVPLKHKTEPIETGTFAEPGPPPIA